MNLWCFKHPKFWIANRNAKHAWYSHVLRSHQFFESLSFLEVNVMQYVGLTAVSLSVMKTVHSWACMKDKMVATVFLSKTSNDCCSSKIRLARSSNTYNTTPNTPSHGLSASIQTDFLLKYGEISIPGFACSPAAMSRRVVRCVALYQRKPGTKKSPFQMKNKAIVIEPERDRSNKMTMI